MPDNLSDRIRQAQVEFVTRASRLLDEADVVRAQRDELLRLIREAEIEQTPQPSKNNA